MSATNLVFLPPPGGALRWMRLEDGRVAGEGDGPPPRDAPAIAVAPAEAVTLHWAELPARSSAQAAAAARIMAAEASAAPMSELHVAVGGEEAEDGGRAIGVVNAGAMAGWLSMLAEAGIDPVALVPAPLLLPRPDSGYALGSVGGQAVVRGRHAGFADDAALTPLVTGGALPEPVPEPELVAAMAAAVAAVPLDLRQGVFARRRRRAIDWRLIRRLALMGLAILALTLAIDLVRIARYSFAADAAEARADALARTVLPRGETVTDADRQLAERLAGVRGPGLGFSRSAAAVFAVVRAVPGTEITALDFQPSGDMRLGIAVEREALATDLKRAIEAAGFDVQAGTFTAAGGRITGEFTVRVR